jgi:hypothetical protein
VVFPWVNGGALGERQQLFLDSVDGARRDHVVTVAVSDAWTRAGWVTKPVRRTAALLGDSSHKPFLRDLLDQALELASPADWLLCGNVDCSLSPDFFDNLGTRAGTVVEYQRQDVLNHPGTLEELYAFPRSPFPIGMDAFAIRASFYAELQGHFPDFVLGEPHWDTALSGLLRKLVPLERDTTRLFHPKHVQAWDLGNLTPAGAHNNKLYVDILTYGLAEDHIIREADDQTDTAVIVAVFGDADARVQAHIHGLRQQRRQDLLADVYLVEITDADAGASRYPADVLAGVTHVPVPGGPANADLFQKEAMFNIGWRAALQHHRYDYFVFIDADVYCDRSDFFRQIRQRLRDNPARAVHGFEMVTDTVDPDWKWSSLAASYQLGRPTDLNLNPGICWGLHREMLEAAAGFNPYSFGGCGDSMFVAEFLNRPDLSYDPWLYQFRFFQDIYRDLPFRAAFDFVPLELKHAYHGPLSDRNYDGVRYAADGLPPMHTWLRIDESGLLAWSDPDGVAHRILRDRSRMHSRESVDALFLELGVDRVPHPGFDGQFSPRDKPEFHLREWTPPASLSQLATVEPDVHLDVRRLNLYNPVRIFRTSFPFSWCGNVRRDESNHIPSVVRDGVPRLVLDGLPGVPWVTAVLAMETNWQCVDLSGFTHLHFTLLVTGDTLPYVTVGFVVTASDGTETDTPVVQVRDLGLALGDRRAYVIPLAAFWADGIDRTRIRLARWSGGGSFSMELSGIYVD